MKIFTILFLLSAVGSAWMYSAEEMPVHTGGEDPRFSTHRYNKSETDWEDYIWPTDASFAKTSSFCEFRKTHFHAGIDISTNMKRGYKVFAVRDGWLHSIEFEPGGYGWFLVIRHYDGYYTCYAHLDGFPSGIEQAYWKRLESQNMSYGKANWGKEDVAVKQGDVVAFTGSTGAGPPHLHFEIRDRKFNPVNPALAPKLLVPDSKNPIIKQIAFVPLDDRSSVNGKYKTLILNAVRVNDTLYRLRKSIYIYGRVGMQLKALDGAEGFKDMESPYRIRSFVNNSQRFDVCFDRIQDDHEWFIRIDRNNSLMQARKGEFRKLYKEPGNTLSVYLPDSSWAGVLSSGSEDNGTVSIRTEDASGNHAALNFAVKFLPECKLSIAAVSTSEVSLEIQHSSPGLFVVCTEAGAKKARALGRWSAKELAQVIYWTVPDPARAYRFQLKHSEFGLLQELYVSRKVSKKQGSLFTSYSISGAEIRITVKASDVCNIPPKVYLADESGTKYEASIRAIDSRTYRASITAPDMCTGPFTILTSALVAGSPIRTRTVISETFVSSLHGATLKSEDGACSIRIDNSDVISSTFFSLGKRLTEDGAVYSIHPSDLPLAGKLRVRIRPAGKHDGKNFIRASHPAVYMRYGTKGFDGNADYVEASFGRYPATYSLERDSIAPSIGIKKSRKGKWYISISDGGSGVDPHSILVKSGNVIVPLHYYERRGVYEIPVNWLRTRKISNIVVTANDRVGNFAIREYQP